MEEQCCFSGHKTVYKEDKCGCPITCDACAVPEGFTCNPDRDEVLNIVLTGQVLAQEAGQSFAWAFPSSFFCASAGEVAAKSSIRNGTFMMITQ